MTVVIVSIVVITLIGLFFAIRIPAAKPLAQSRPTINIEFEKKLATEWELLENMLFPTPTELTAVGFERGRLFEFVATYALFDTTTLEINEIPKGTTALFMGFDNDGTMKMLIKGTHQQIPRSAHTFLKNV